MMSASHDSVGTPGPWIHDGMCRVQGNCDGHRYDICHIDPVAPHIEHSVAIRHSNARLIAAAPDLYQACRAALDLLTRKVDSKCPMPDEPGFKEHVTKDCEAFALQWDEAEKILSSAINKAKRAT